MLSILTGKNFEKHLSYKEYFKLHFFNAYGKKRDIFLTLFEKKPY